MPDQTPTPPTRPEPHSPQYLAAPDIFAAVRDFINVFVVDPPLQAVIEKEFDPPEELTNYAVVSVLSEVRRGQNVHSLIPEDPLSEADEDCILECAKLVLAVVEIEIRSEQTRRARETASLIELWARDEQGSAFFKPHGVGITGCNGPLNTAFTENNPPLSPRFAVTLTLEYWAKSSLWMPSFDTVTLQPKQISP